MQQEHIIIASIIASIPVVFGIVYKSISKKSQKIQKSNNLHWVRRIFHMVVGTAIMYAYSFLQQNQAIIAVFLGILYLLAIHILRTRSKYLNDIYIDTFKFMLRPYETVQLPGAFYYLLGAWIIIFNPNKPAFYISMTILSYGDPFASIFGIYFGGFKIREGKSLSGSLGCSIISSFICCILLQNLQCFSVIYDQIDVQQFFYVIMIISFISEVLPTYLDDNLTIPVYSNILIMLYFKFYLNIDS